MGCGKTTLGRALGAMSSLRFIDLDSHIEAVCHCSIGEIFNREGEDGFRLLEHNVLMQLAVMRDVVIACGGGTPCFHDNMALMNDNGTTVFMDTSMTRILARLKVGRRCRPLLAGLDDVALEKFVVETYRKRIPYYEQAKAVFSGDLLETLDEVELSARRFIQSFNLK